jgi:hypothetical protein
MKFLMQAFAFLAIFGVIYLVIMNYSDTITLQVLPQHYDSVAQTVIHSTKTFNIAFLMLAVLGAGLLSGICLFVPFYLMQTEQLYAYKRELEKSSIKTDSSSSQVKVLQAKVQVLEKALKEALK